MKTMNEWHKSLDRFLNMAISSRGDYLAIITNFLLPCCLHWNNDDIQHQPLNDTGHDMVLLSTNKTPQVIIESRPANHEQQEDDILMLSMFMKQFDVNIGMYFGERVEVYYKESASKRAFKLFEIELSANDPKWEQFYTLFERSTFNPQRICAYYSDRLRVIQDENLIEQQIEELTAEKGHEIIENAITEFLHQQEIPSGLIDAILSKLDITITRNDGIATIAAANDIPSDTPQYIPNKIYQKARFSINGKGNYGVGRLALAIVTIITKQNPQLTYSQLKRKFNILRENIKSVNEINDWKAMCSDSHKDHRWFESIDEILTAGDGIKFAVSTQWSRFNVQDMIAVGRTHGLEIIQINQPEKF